MSQFEHTVAAEQAGLRIDKLLSDIQEDVSRSQAQSWIKEDLVTVNGTTVKNKYTVQEGDEIAWSIPEPEEMEIKAENIPLEIVYEDADIAVVNKPRGMVVHPSNGHQSGTMVHALLYHLKDLSGINGTFRPGIVHRIDKDTSGLLVVAKHDKAHQKLTDMLKDHDIERKYRAIVHGVIDHEYGTIEAPIGRDPNDRQKMAVVENGKPAVTHFEVLERFEGFTYIECKLETGRTHQIRVHMQYISYPLAGDPKYGPRRTLDIGGQALHAAVLGLHHPITGEWMRFEAPVPEVFQAELDKLKFNA
ncbi:ribosomal large subunit pseudouridine synthase D [Terribacillus aidingensis]|uniref:Pseudouridine synthase n=1 Tax=Terribacillus aidingensis TaxID=586416 RepID=A0A285NKF2_9BACI|nr:RluA family pseudouridine synthase [Terribacillus aidingensis]SNZ09413.1 ribosomal large subunit pseudouridine synthase D [Terribacillus aidingensis]